MQRTQRYLGSNWKFLTFLEIETMEILLLCFFVGGFTLGSAFGCGATLWGMMDRANKARKASPESMAMQEAYRD
jgi:hypothetical protein